VSTGLGISSLGASLISAESLTALKRDSELLRTQIDGLSSQIQGHEEQIAALKQQRAVVQDAIEKIQSLTLSVATEQDSIILTSAHSPSRVGPISVSHPPAPATLAEQIEVVIRTAGTPLHYKEILSRLQAEGVDVGGKDPAATLLSILANKRYEARFARAERGIYTLAGEVEPHSATRPSKRRRRRVRTTRPAGRSS
jgi:hypothetical protein